MNRTYQILRRNWLPSVFAVFFMVNFLLISSVSATSRIKDIANFEGVRDNLLVGYGLVVGLNNTGDTLADGHFTKQSLLAMLERLGVKPTENGLSSKNVAAVMVTASLSGFTRQGSRVDAINAGNSVIYSQRSGLSRPQATLAF